MSPHIIGEGKGNGVGADGETVQSLSLLWSTYARMGFSDEETFDALAAATLLVKEEHLHALVRAFPAFVSFAHSTGIRFCHT